MEKVTNVFIGNGGALPNGTQFTLSNLTNRLGIVKSDMTFTNAATTISDSDTLYIAQKKSATDLKKSFAIKGLNLAKAEAQVYAPAQKCVWAVGYNRKTATGAIEVNNEAIYELTIVDKSNKQLGSERQIFKRYNYTSDASATQLEIAKYFVNAINADYTRGVHNVKAKLVYAGAYAAASGSTPEIFGDNSGGTDYGIELYGEPQTPFVDQYTMEVANFEVHINSELGFDATPIAMIQGANKGTGTLVEVAKFEKFANGFEGQTNYRAWPVIEPASLTATSLTLSGNITSLAATAVAATSLDMITFGGAATGIIFPGDIIQLDGGVEYEILYFKSATVAFAKASGTADASSTVKRYVGYSTIVLETAEVVIGGGSRHTYTLPQRVVIFTPGIDAGDTSATSNSAEGAHLLTVLGGASGWVASTPKAITLATSALNINLA